MSHPKWVIAFSLDETYRKSPRRGSSAGSFAVHNLISAGSHLEPKRFQLINRFGRELWLILKWANPLFPRMVGNSNLYLAHVVAVVQLWQLMAEAVRVYVGARFACGREKRRVHRDANNVV